MAPTVTGATKSHSRGTGMRGIRVREGEFEGQCTYCREYLPLTFEFWPTRNAGLRRCRACLLEYKRVKQLGYVNARRAAYNAAVRLRVACLSPDDKARRRAANRDWKARNRDRIAAYNREYRDRRRAA